MSDLAHVRSLTESAGKVRNTLKSPHPTGELTKTLQSDQAFVSIFETIVDAVIIINERGIICRANPATETEFGYSPDELVGRNVSVLMEEPFRSEHDGYIQRYCETGEARIIGIGRQVIAVRRDGVRVPVDLAVSEFRFQGERYFTGVLRDISEQVASQEQLRTERDFSQNLIDAAHAIILVLSPNGGIERFNPYVEELTGYSLAEVVGEDWFETFVPEQMRSQTREIFEFALAGRPTLNNVNAIRTKDGRERIITWSGRRLTNVNDEIIGFLAIGNDVTDLKATEQKLVQSERLAAIGQMMAGLAHESRNALQRSQASLEMLTLDLDGDAEKVKLIDRIQRALHELQRLYEEVRNYASPIQLEMEPVSLEPIIRETWLDVCESKAHDRHRLRVEDLTDNAVVPGDRNRLQQVIRNILENAIAAAPSDSIVQVHIEPSQIGQRMAVCCRFCDQGPGFNSEQMKRVFEPFYTTKTRGTGLGMAISKRIVDAHHGCLIANNHHLGGAMVSLILPLSS